MRPERGLAAPVVARGGSRRITFLINSMEGGGAERAMANLLTHLVPRLKGHRVELVLLDDLPIEQDLPAGLEIHRLGAGGRMLRSAVKLGAFWRSADHRPDLCVSFLARSNVVNVLLARFFGHRSVISERVHTSSHIGKSRAAPVLRWITRRFYPAADRVVAVSSGVAADLRDTFGVPAEKLVVIGNAIERDRLRRLAAERPAMPLPDDFMLAMGRLVPNKNFALLLDGYARTPGAPPLVIIGRGPEEDNLRAQADRLGLGDRVTFGGYIDNPYPIVARARALISVSRAEGFPNALVEALTLGCPVIATDCPSGPAEILDATAQSGPPWSATSHGILIAMEDCDALVAAIGTLCDDAVRAAYAERAVRRGADFGHEAVVTAYEKVFSEAETDCFPNGV